VNLQEHWEEEYREHRYMERCSDADLQQRRRDIFQNWLVLTPDGKIGLRNPNKGGAFWMRQFAHLLQETGLRGMGFYPEFLKSLPVPKATWPKMPKAITALGGRSFTDGRFLFKFGKEKYLRESFEKGRKNCTGVVVLRSLAQSRNSRR
jgi:hypothetical protein